MRLSAEQLSTLNKSGLLQVLQEGYDVFNCLDQFAQNYEQTKAQIEGVKSQSQQIANGNQGNAIFIGIGSLILGFLFTRSLIYSILFVVLGIVIFRFVDKRALANKRHEKAKAYEEEALPPLQEKKKKLEDKIVALSNIDSYYNICSLLPKEYLSSKSILGIFSFLQSNRAATLGEAINFYEEQQHRLRMENIEKQKLQAAQIAAEAQVRSANAQERFATAQMKTADSMKAMVAEQKRTTEAIRSAENQMANNRMAKQTASSSVSTRGTVMCRECRQRIDKHAQVCPYCGRATEYSGTASGIIAKKLGF